MVASDDKPVGELEPQRQHRRVDVVVLFSGPRHCGVPARPAWQPLRGRLGLSPICRPAAHHIAPLLHTYRMACLWLWHTYHMALMALMALMASCQQPSHACLCHNYHMPRLCHTHSSPAPGASTCGQAAPGSRTHVEPESMRRRAGAMHEASETPHVRRRGRIRHGGDEEGRDEGPGGRFDASTARAVGSLMSRARTAAGAKTTGPFSPTPPAPAMRFPSLTPPFPAQLSLTPRLSFLGVLPFTSLPSNLTPLCGLATKERAERGAAEGCLKPRAFWPLTAFLPHMSRLTHHTSRSQGRCKEWHRRRCKEWHRTIARALLLSPWHRLCLTALASHAVYVHVAAREAGRGIGREGHLGADEGGAFLGF